MAKPDPIPRFVEVSPPGTSIAPAESVTESVAGAVSALPDWVDQFLSDREIRPNTRKMYEWQLRRFQRWLQHKPWQEVTESDINGYKNCLETKPTKHGQGLKPASINQALASIRSFYEWLYHRRYITFNPALTIELVVLSEPKLKNLRASIVHELGEGLSLRGQLSVRDAAIVWVLKHGLSAAEVGTLNIDDYRQRALQVERTKGASDGLVPLSPNACCAVESYLEWCLEEGLDMSSNKPLFRSQSNRNYGARMSYRAIYNLIKDLAAIAGATAKSSEQ